MEMLGLALAVLIGLSLGLLGGGGSILAVPILVYVVGLGAKQAIASSLIVVGISSLFGALSHRRAGNVDLRTAIPFGVVAMGGAFLGARLALRVNGTVQLLVFAAVMLVAAVFMFRGRPKEFGATGDRTPGIRRGLAAGAGLSVGALTGFVGVGGGFLIVPALVLVARLPMKRAVGTSLLVIAMNSAAGFAGYLGHVEFPWRILGLFTAAAIGGIVPGTCLVRYVSQDTLRRAFAMFLLVVGSFILQQNWGAISSAGEPARGVTDVARPAAGSRLRASGSGAPESMSAVGKRHAKFLRIVTSYVPSRLSVEREGGPGAMLTHSKTALLHPW